MILKTNSILLSILEFLVFLFGIISNYTYKEISAISCCICLALFCMIWIVAKTTNAKISPFYAGKFILILSAVPFLNKSCYKIELMDLFLYSIPVSFVLYSLIKKCICYKKEKPFRVFIKKFTHYSLVLLFSLIWLVQINMSMDFYPDQTYTGTVLNKNRTTSTRYGPSYSVSVQYIDCNDRSIRLVISVDEKSYLKLRDNCSVVLEHYAGALRSSYYKLVVEEHAEAVLYVDIEE